MQAQQQQQGTPAPSPTTAAVQQKQAARNDQNNGDLHPIITRLAALMPTNGTAGTTPITEVLAALKAQDPEAFAIVDRMAAAVGDATTSSSSAGRLSDEEANRWKGRGNEEFGRQAYQESLLSYTQGLMCSSSDGATATLLDNRSTALFSLGRFADACMDAHRAFVLNPSYAKALLRRGRCLCELGFTELGERDMAAAAAAATDENSNSSSSCAGACSPEEVAALFGCTATHGMAEAATARPPRAALHVPVTVERNAKGRGLFSTERLEAGVVVLEETPIAIATRAETLLSVCSLCAQFVGGGGALFHGEAFRAAGVKHKGFFCSDACAAAAWEREKGEGDEGGDNNEEEERGRGVSGGKRAFYLCCPNDALLALRVMRAATGSTAAVDISGRGFSAAGFDPINGSVFGADHLRTLQGGHSKELVDNATNPSNNSHTFCAVGGFETVVACLALHMGAVAKPAQAEQLRKTQRQLLCNSFDITCTVRSTAPGGGDDTTSDGGGGVVTSNATVHVAKAVYAIGALVNHACDPNCHASFLNNPRGSSAQLVIKTIRPVMAGEELTISYGGIDAFTFHSMRNRLTTLRERFGFVCRCPTCMNQVDEPVKEAEKQHYIKASDYYQKGRRMIREGQFDTAVTVLLQSYEMVMRFICAPPAAPQLMVPKTHDALALAYFHLGNRVKCLEHMKAALATDIEVHKGNANRLSLVNEFTRVAFVEVDGEERQRYCARAVELLRRFYAPSPMLELEVAYTESCYKK